MKPSELAKGWHEALKELYPTAKPLPGAYFTVEEGARRGLLQAVATSSSKSAVVLKRLPHEEMFMHFRTVVTGDDPEVKNGKPSPDIFLLAAKRLGADPSRCLVFEDSPFGVTAAKDAGMFCVAVPEAHMDKERFMHADLVRVLIALSW